MLSLSRYGDTSAGTKGPVDNLTMTYDGNRLVSVQDVAQAVTMSGSRAKQGLSARDWPAELHSRAKQGLFAREGPSEQHSRAKQGLFAREGLSEQHSRAKQRLFAREGQSERQGSITESWRYLPDGTKLSLSLSDANGPASVTDYRGNLVYKDGVLKDILADGGLIDMTEASPRYVFFLKDHLGSVRVAAMLNGMKVQTNLYYPYGMSYASSALAGSPSAEDGGDIQVFPGESIPEIPGTPEIAEEFISTIPYRFCGKEQNLADGLGMYDFLARRYDPVLCRFTSPDPLAEKFPSVSPYAYCANDPVNKVDPDGKSPSIFGGAIAGAALEYGTQVLSNLLSGESFGQSITDINGKSILISAGAGAVGVGLATKAKQFASLGKTMKAVLTVSEESVLGAAQSAIDQSVTEESVSWKEVAVDAAISGIGTGAGMRAKTVRQSSQEYKQAKRALDHAERVARGTNPRQSRLDKVTVAQEKLDNVGERQSNIVKNSSILVGSSLKELGISYTKRIEDEK